MSREMFELLVNQNRRRVVGEVVSIKLAMDYFNARHPNDPPVQTSFNYEIDVQEMTQIAAPIPVPAPGSSSSGR